jgi:hypothetical protein
LNRKTPVCRTKTLASFIRILKCTIEVNELSHRGTGDYIYGAGDSTRTGTAGLMPIVRDWNGDGSSDVGLYDPSIGAFTLYSTSTIAVNSWGGSGDQGLVFF